MIPCPSQELLPFLSVIYPFLPPYSTCTKRCLISISFFPINTISSAYPNTFYCPLPIFIPLGTFLYLLSLFVMISWIILVIKSNSVSILCYFYLGYNNNFITNSSYKKFLWVTMNNTLSWNKHIDLLVKKLRKACYIIRNAKTYMSAPSWKVIYCAFFHLVMSHGIIWIIFWG